MKLKVVAISIYLILFSFKANAISFVADAISTNGTTTSKSKIFVKNHKVRIEYTFDGEQFIQISNPTKKRSWILLVNDKTYIESKTSVDLLPKSIKINLKKLCKPKNIQCFKGKTSIINSKTALQWKIDFYKNKTKQTSYLWVDTKTGIPLKQKYSDGSYSELNFIKLEKVNNRVTQKWQLTLVNRLKQKITINQWFDPNLNLTIKEVYPDNTAKELKNIKIIKLKNSLFELPKGYTKNTQLNN